MKAAAAAAAAAAVSSNVVRVQGVLTAASRSNYERQATPGRQVERRKVPFIVLYSLFLFFSQTSQVEREEAAMLLVQVK